MFLVSLQDKENGANKLLYIIDHWTGQTDPALYEKFEKTEPEMELLFVPEKTTGECQPLDTYFNRKLKYITRKIYSYAMVHGNEFGDPEKLIDRNSILKIQSLLHFLLSAPIFVPMIKHSWRAAGLTTEPIPFMNAYSILFQLKMPNCIIINCTTAPFINCSWCRQELCFHHFFNDYHMMECLDRPYTQN